jgi:hypothetical protein
LSSFGVLTLDRWCHLLLPLLVLRQVYEVLNEIVLDRGSNSFLTNIEAYIQGRFITRVQVRQQQQAVSGLHVVASLPQQPADSNVEKIAAALQLLHVALHVFGSLKSATSANYSRLPCFCAHISHACGTVLLY